MFQNNHNKSGFTLVETMMSVVFISILLIAIGTVSMHIINTYRRGVVVKMVNETGRAISDDIRASLSSGNFSFDRGDYVNRPGYGILCTGKYTYMWNYAEHLKEPKTHILRYQGASDTDTFSDDNCIRMIKIPDQTRNYCTIKDHSSIVILPPSSSTGQQKAIELIKPSEGDLMVHDFNITKGAYDNDRALYQVSFSIGTNQYKEIIKDKQCIPNEFDQAGCAINRFDISILTKER
jgi:type II secretory pathway pseudopilin PulG